MKNVPKLVGELETMRIAHVITVTVFEDGGVLVNIPEQVKPVERNGILAILRSHCDTLLARGVPQEVVRQ
jgi:hypothetical protein